MPARAILVQFIVILFEFWGKDINFKGKDYLFDNSQKCTFLQLGGDVSWAWFYDEHFSSFWTSHKLKNHWVKAYACKPYHRAVCNLKGIIACIHITSVNLIINKLFTLRKKVPTRTFLSHIWNSHSSRPDSVPLFIVSNLL